MSIKRTISTVIATLFILCTMAAGLQGFAEDSTLTPAMTIVADMEGELSAVRYWSNGNADIQLAEDVSPLGQAVEVVNPSAAGVYPEFLLSSQKLTAAEAAEVDGVAFWVKAPDKEIGFNMDMRYDSGQLAAGGAYVLIAEDGAVTNKNIAGGIAIPANFTGWAVVPKAGFNNDFNAGTLVAFGFNYDPAGFLGASFYLDSFGFYTDYDELAESLGATSASAKRPITEITAENKEMVVLNDGSSVQNGVGIAWDSGVAQLAVSDASPDGKALSITPPAGVSSIEVCPYLEMPDNIEADIKAEKYTGFAFWYKAPTANSGTAGVNFFEEKQKSDGTWTRTCFGLNSFSEYYTIDKDNKFEEHIGSVAVPAFEGWVFIPFDSFVRGWGNNEELGDVELEPWAMHQLDITYNPKGEGSDGVAAIYDDFSFYTTIDKVKTAFEVEGEPQEPVTSDDGKETDDESPATNDGSDPGGNPKTGGAPLVPLAMLGAAGAVMVLRGNRRREKAARG